MATFYRVTTATTDVADLEALAERLLASPAVEAAYVKPASSAPV